MVRVIEYINKKKYVWDTKTGRWWRFGGTEGPKKEEKKLEGKRGPPGLKTRYQPGTVALHEIRKFQKSTSFLIRKLPSKRWVGGIAKQIQGDLRFQAIASLPSRKQWRPYIINHSDDANLCVIHGKCITMMPKDIQLAWKIQEDMVKHLSRWKKNFRYINIYLLLYISSVTPDNVGKNLIPHGSGIGSAIVSHLEILALTHQPNSECHPHIHSWVQISQWCYC